jgi:transcriptional regulator with PAS, ATPase and Fis domain
MVRAQRFRLDLFYRLQVLVIRVPSLRERGEDILTLAQHFLAEFTRSNPTLAVGFSRSALARIEQHDWPGNLRELRNCMHQAVLSCTGRYITPADLRLERLSDRIDSVTLQEAREAAEVRVIRSALKRNDQNTTRAAEELQVSRMTLYRLLQKHGLDQ